MYRSFPLFEAAGEGSGGGGGDNPPAFDQDAFKKTILDEVTKMLNGGLGRLEKTIKELKPKEADQPPPDPEMPKGEDRKVQREIELLKTQVAAEKAAREKAEQAAREQNRISLIRAEIGKLGLSESALDDAERYFRESVKYTDDGELVGGKDELPLSDFAKSVIANKQHWLPPKQSGGAGASNSGGSKGGGGIDIDAIRPGMSAEELAAATAAITAALPSKN